MKSYCLKKLMVLAWMFGFGVIPGEAVVLVDFNTATDYATGNFNHMNGYSVGVPEIAYSETTGRNPTGANYNATLNSAIFYGAAKSTTDSGLTAFRVSATEVIQASSSGAGISDFMHVLIVWQKPNFLNGQDEAGDISLFGGTMVATIDSTASGRASNMRYVIKTNGNYIISEVVQSVTGTQTRTPALQAVEGFAWYAYDPFNAMETIGGLVSPGTFSNVTAVGLWTESIVTSNTALSVTLSDFRVEAIPEPSLGLLLSGGMGLLWMLRGRRM